MAPKYDFCGWATRNDIQCSDGRTIRKDAFKHNDGQTVPLVWNHAHSDPLNVLGNALLENRENGVYAYCSFNNTEAGQSAKEAVRHGDVNSLSIFANKLTQKGGDVIHGMIREVSLVLAGANPGAKIETIIEHGDGEDETAIIYNGESLELAHADDETPKTEKENTKMAEENTKTTVTKSEDEETVEDVFNTLTDKQKNVVYAIIGQALEDAKSEKDNAQHSDFTGDEEVMKHNVFDGTEMNDENVISHSEMKDIITDAKRYGSMKESVLQHGIDDIEYLFPDAKEVNSGAPEFIKREDSWVTEVMNATHHTPFSRIKSTFANITEDEARAKGYIKGKMKKEEFFSLIKRTTEPTTVYKKPKLDRDDVVDITSFDVVAWLKTEMRGMLNEELARAFLIGDGRVSGDEDKIDELHIRPIWTDEDLFTIKSVTRGTDAADIAAKFIDDAVRARKNYKGSGSPVFYASEDIVTECLLLKDTMGHRLYPTMTELANAIRASKIVPVPVMDGVTRSVSGETRNLLGIMVNLTDYNVGADNGGSVNMFDDFDIDYNQMKYLIETRCSGAMIKPYAAIAFESVVTTG